jgi:outer membrane protein assembly factor BamB
VLLFRVEGLTGAAKVNFGFRHRSSAPAQSEWHDPPAVAQKVILDSDGKNEFTQFQGPNRSAVLTGIHLARDWNAKPPTLLWRKPVGAGWSGFAVSGQGAITQEQRGDRECVVCRSLATGDELWVHSDGAHYNNTLGGPGPRATPTIFEGQVYTIGATGILNCLDGQTGSVRWQVNVLDDNGAENAYHGVCSSPLIVDGFVVVCPTGKDGKSMAAYDRRDGRRCWAEGNQRASYASPMLAEIGGVRQILYLSVFGLASHDPATGAVLWEYPWSNSEKTNCSQPIVVPGQNDKVLATTGYGGGSVLVQVKRAADGHWESPEKVWTSRHMKTKFTTAVAGGKYVFGLDDGILQCIDLENGNSKWKRGRYGHGQLLLVDDLLLIQTEPGDVVLVEANPNKLVELGRMPALDGKTWNCPSLAGKFLLTRNDHEAVCFELPLADE